MALRDFPPMGSSAGRCAESSRAPSEFEAGWSPRVFQCCTKRPRASSNHARSVASSGSRGHVFPGSVVMGASYLLRTKVHPFPNRTIMPFARGIWSGTPQKRSGSASFCEEHESVSFVSPAVGALSFRVAAHPETGVFRVKKRDLGQIG